MYNNQGGYGGQQAPRDKTNSGYLYPNAKKMRAEQPDIKGKLNINGVDWYISGWNKVDQKNGQSFFSIKITPITQGAQGAYNAPQFPAAQQPSYGGSAPMQQQPSVGHTGYAPVVPQQPQQQGGYQPKPYQPQQQQPSVGHTGYPPQQPQQGKPQQMTWQAGGDEIPF